MKVTCNCVVLCYGEESFSDMIVCFYLDILFSYLKTNKQLNREEIIELIKWKKDKGALALHIWNIVVFNFYTSISIKPYVF